MKTILIIDDEPSIVMILKELLSNQGYNILTAFNGSDGINLLVNKKSPDLVLLDLNMPGTSGKMVIDTMRKHTALSNTPVIIITGAIRNQIDFPEEGSYQALINKPFELEEVLSKVKELLP